MANEHKETEQERQFRVVDQMLTMHSLLRDRYIRWSRLLDYSILGSSVMLNAFVFSGDDTYLLFGVAPSQGRLLVSVVSVFVLVVSLVAVSANLSERGRTHQNAVTELANLKAEGRRPDGGELKSFNKVMATIPPIPDRLFNHLKSKHVAKVALSQMISEFPGAPVWILKLKLIFLGSRRAWRNKL